MSLEPKQNHLLIIEDDKGRREFILDAPHYSIGRDPKCDIRLVSQFVSRRHATLVQLTQDDGSFTYRIVDGNAKGRPSANGLLINGRKLQAHDLTNEDEVVFGPKVRAIYYLLRRDAVVTVPPDEFDITLISPNMIGDPEDDAKDDRALWQSEIFANENDDEADNSLN
jgi:pSer/pThr/pTyr-binding forkhead associated (FHA) protein